MKIKKIVPCGNMVLLKLVEQKKAEDFKTTKSGLIIPSALGADAASVATSQGGEKKKVVAYIEAVGPLVPADVVFKIGDEVMYNSYDLMTLGDEDSFYGLTKSDSILAVITAER